MGKKVAVIGAGLAGLPVIRYLTSSSSHSTDPVEVIGYERNDVVGGTWVYTDKTGIDIDGLAVHSSMYRNVRSNLPKDLFSYFDFPYKNKLPSFTGHDEVLEYIESFADHFKLRQFIKFNTLVTRVTPLTSDIGDTRWEVTCCNRFDQSNTSTEEFDYVVVCNGHTSVPYVPRIPGQENFKGQIVHSHEYRQPEIFRDKTVLCIGGMSSAADIAIGVSDVAKKVILCKPEVVRFNFQTPEAMLVRDGIKCIKQRSVVFSNGDEEVCNVIIYCTGYTYSYPFLTKECRIVVEDEGKRVTPLYKHSVNIEIPTLFFVGIPDVCALVNVMDIQAGFVTKIIKGELRLAGKAEMAKDAENEMEKRLSEPGNKTRHIHQLGFSQTEYMNDLLCMMGNKTLPKDYADLFEKVVESFISDTLRFRDRTFEVHCEPYIFL